MGRAWYAQPSMVENIVEKACNLVAVPGLYHTGVPGCRCWESLVGEGAIEATPASDELKFMRKLRMTEEMPDLLHFVQAVCAAVDELAAEQQQ